MIINKLTAPASETEIKSHWKHVDKVYVSVVCITFNQEFYIREAIDSFLAQETEYRFEVVIHDDVSTDLTRDILLAYKEKYPTIIKLVLQDTNQYSLGKKITPLAVAHAAGEYLALCEGDDYWNSKKKLQMQLMALLENNVEICVHPAYRLDNSGRFELSFDIANKNEVISPFKFISLGGSACATNSIFMKRRIFDNLPDWYDDAPVGDLYLQAISASYLNRGVAYLDSTMSTYRVMSEGSWSMQIANDVQKEFNLIHRIEVYHQHLLSILDEDYKKPITQFLGRRFLEVSIINLKNNQVSNFTACLHKSFGYLGIRMPKSIIMLIIKKIIKKTRSLKRSLW